MPSEHEMTARQHAERIAELIREAQHEACADVERVADPRAKALFETVAEVLEGSRRALEEYATERESAWR